jgi:hypothetical protein
MSADVMTERVAEPSPRFIARAVGVFWLLTILTGTFSMIALDRPVVSGDAAATAANILAHEPSLRWGVAGNLVAGACYVVATLFVYVLLKPVNRNLSLLAAFFSLLGCATGALSSVFQLAPLVVLGGAPYLSVFPAEQLQALAYMFLKLTAQASSIGFIFFGLHCLLIGCLILRSTFLPRTVGALMVFAGIGWLTLSFSSLLSPPFARNLFPYIMIPGFLGEASLTLWLLVMGVNVQRWKEQAGASGDSRS